MSSLMSSTAHRLSAGLSPLSEFELVSLIAIVVQQEAHLDLTAIHSHKRHHAPDLHKTSA
jgi:hypothetical protein